MMMRSTKKHSLFIFLLATAATAVTLRGKYDTVLTEINDFSTIGDVITQLNNFKDSTLSLGADMDFTGIKHQILGDLYNRRFMGTFDGQGYVIKNLELNSSNLVTGLFGSAEGATFRNVVVDQSCSITNMVSENPDYPKTGSIVGSCATDCALENVVNMGSVTFAGYTPYSQVNIGGIAGYFKSNTRITNCANYGTVTVNVSVNGLYIGGLFGSYNGPGIQNSINYGAIIFTKESSYYKPYIGGLTGEMYSQTFVNCVSAGNVQKGKGYAGAFAGHTTYGSTFLNCYWSDTSLSISGHTTTGETAQECSTFDNNTFTLTSSTTAGNYTGSSLIEALNAAVDMYYLLGFSRWFLNKDRKTASFTVNNRTNSFATSQELILAPSLADMEKNWFDGWYTDAACTVSLDNYEISTDTSLYGKWGENTNSYVITFDTRGGALADPITAEYNSFVTLYSDVEKKDFTLSHWETDQGYIVSFNFQMPARNITLYAVWARTHISTAQHIIEFSNTVNSGTNYRGTTVFLDVDIDLSIEQLDPIGKSSSYYFEGTFDGQGHTINNLTMNSSSSQYAGLFGYSKATIRNVVIDDSCSFVSSYSSSNPAYVGSLVGYNVNGSASSIVNMASVSFTGSIPDHESFIGGIAGSFGAAGGGRDAGETALRNCVNYGTVKYSGVSYIVQIGGIAGNSFIDMECSANYGAVACAEGTANETYVGGIVGTAGSIAFRVMLSGGMIFASKSTNASVGSFVGKSYETCTSVNCVWTKDVGNIAFNGFNSSEVTADELYFAEELNKTVLNKFSSMNETWNKWVKLNLNGGSIVEIPQKHLIVTQKHFPDPVKQGNTFMFWCEDERCNKKYDPKTSNITDIEELYAAWSTVSVVFDFGNGTTVTKNMSYGQTYGDFPEAEKEGHKFVGWVTEASERVAAEDTVNRVCDHTLYAKFVVNNYTITFNLGNGFVNNKTLEYNEIIEYPKTPEREGYTFGGWDRTIKRMPAENIVITALWLEKPSELVEIVLEVKNMTKEKAKEVIEKYTDEEFTIEKFEVDEKTGETKIIIKFVDTKKAEEFVRTVNNIVRESSDNFIKNVNVINADFLDFSFKVIPSLLLLFITA